MVMCPSGISQPWHDPLAFTSFTEVPLEVIIPLRNNPKSRYETARTVYYTLQPADIIYPGLLTSLTHLLPTETSLKALANLFLLPWLPAYPVFSVCPHGVACVPSPLGKYYHEKLNTVRPCPVQSCSS